MESSWRFLDKGLRTDRTLYWTKCSGSCQTLLKLEITTSVEVITKRWRKRDFRLKASWSQSKASTIPVNTNYFLKNTVGISKYWILRPCWMKEALLRIKMYKRGRKDNKENLIMHLKMQQWTKRPSQLKANSF